MAQIMLSDITKTFRVSERSEGKGGLLRRSIIREHKESAPLIVSASKSARASWLDT